MRKFSNKEEFVKKAIIIHDNVYDYSNFVYVNAKYKSCIICKIHGEFEQRPTNHLSGRGCLKCGDKKITERLCSNKKDFMRKSTEIHNNRYNYDNFEYINARRKSYIGCIIHGIFAQTADSHLKGRGCPKCANIKTGNISRCNKTEFIQKANLVHNFKYDYSNFEYFGAFIKSEIICKYGHAFKQMPTNHLSGYGCPKCFHLISKPETKWLDSLNISLRQHTIQINKKKLRVDGYAPETNTVYQFHGDYWHGNPDKFNLDDYNKTTKCTFRELYQKTLNIDDMIRNNGYTLVIMWENDFKDNSPR